MCDGQGGRTPQFDVRLRFLKSKEKPMKSRFSWRVSTWVLLGTFLLSSLAAHAIPAFARKYGLRCSACHTAWPELNDFGWRFKDNGYQLMNDRDAPIWLNPSYWPVAFRMTPNWHLERTNRVAVDTAAGGTAETQITQHGFDNSGLDILTAGTLEKNISFLLVPSADETGAFHFESVWVRIDNIRSNPWLNVKFGKFELDNFISEKRVLSLSANGGFYQLYHFIPPGDSNSFGQIGDNQLGIEWMGHSLNDHTRVSASLISSNDGSPDLVNANTYSGYFSFMQAFDLGGLGLQRVGAYYYVGEAPTYALTSGGLPVPGSSLGSKSFNREGVFGDFYFSRFEIPWYFQHGSDDKFFGTATPGNMALPPGARNPSWNGAFVEPHFILNPQFIIFQRSEWVRMSTQALPTSPSDFGNLDAYTGGVRWYPIMTSRAGFALHGEYSWVRQRKTAPVSGLDLTNRSVFLGADFDF
jgi:hypothetical protein